MSSPKYTYPEQIEMLHRVVFRQAIELAGQKHGLQPGAATDVAERIRDAYLVHMDTGDVLSRSGESIDDCLARLSREQSSKHLFATAAPSDTSGTLSLTELAKMSPEARLRYANEQQALKKR